MKKFKIFSLAFVGLVAAQSLLIACDQPKQRAEVIDKEIQSQIVPVAEIHDMNSETKKAYFYKTEKNAEIEKTDKTPQIKINDEVQKILNLVKDDVNQAALNDQLIAPGLIAFEISDKAVTIYKVLTATQSVNFIKITSIGIKTAGVLDNKRTKYYDEKMSVLTIAERPLDLSTHLLLDAEVKPETASPATTPTAAM